VEVKRGHIGEVRWRRKGHDKPTRLWRTTRRVAGRPDAAWGRRKESGVQRRAARDLASAATDEDDALFFCAPMREKQEIRREKEKRKKKKEKRKIKRRVRRRE
jgi:hypothetical protein